MDFLRFHAALNVCVTPFPPFTLATSNIVEREKCGHRCRRPHHIIHSLRWCNPLTKNAEEPTKFDCLFTNRFVVCVDSTCSTGFYKEKNHLFVGFDQSPSALRFVDARNKNKVVYLPVRPKCDMLCTQNFCPLRQSRSQASKSQSPARRSRSRSMRQCS